jgi:hypothetical protein
LVKPTPLLLVAVVLVEPQVLTAQMDLPLNSHLLFCLEVAAAHLELTMHPMEALAVALEVITAP